MVTVTNPGELGTVSYAWSPSPVSGQGTNHARYDACGTVKVVVTDLETGCVDSCSAEIVCDTIPPVCTVSPADTSVCYGDPATFCVNPSGGVPPYTYSWTGPNAYASSDSCITVTDSGLYTVTVTGANGCESSCEGLLQNIDCFGGQLTPTQVDCEDFTADTAADLTTICYGIKDDQINNAAPGVFFYWTSFTAPSADFTVDIVQTKDNGSFPFFEPLHDQIVLWDGDCDKLYEGTSTSPGQAEVNITGATPGELLGLDVSPCLGSATEFEPAPSVVELSRNFPNPFNPSTELHFALPAGMDVKLDVYNILGQHVKTLADGYYEAGRHSVTWDASSEASGVYFYRLVTQEAVRTGKMLLLK
jgi:hypothetical protein